jgi:hypothetical protein
VLERILRYVELNASGEPCAEMFSSRIGGASENARWGLLVASAAKKHHTLIRLCNHADDCRNPNLAEIEGDGKGGIRAKGDGRGMDGVELWDARMIQP